MSLAKDAMQKTAAVDLLALAGAKILAQNIFERHGHRVKPIRRAASSLIGHGYRAAVKGRPMPHKHLRNALALIEPSAVKAYETGHAVGRMVRSTGEHVNEDLHGKLGKLLQTAATSSPLKHVAGEHVSDVIKHVPTEATTKFQKAVDYAHKPLSEVGSDISTAVKSRARKLKIPKFRPSRVPTEAMA